MFLWSFLAILIIVSDQLTKYLAIKYISDKAFVTFIPKVIDFAYVENNGAAFNILSGRIGLLSIISLLFVVGVIIYWVIKKPENKILKTALMLLASGAAGNAIDRVFRGVVVDFIKTTFIEFPVFNIADIAITCGAVLLIIYLLFFDTKKE